MNSNFKLNENSFTNSKSNREIIGKKYNYSNKKNMLINHRENDSKNYEYKEKSEHEKKSKNKDRKYLYWTILIIIICFILMNVELKDGSSNQLEKNNKELVVDNKQEEKIQVENNETQQSKSYKEDVKTEKIYKDNVETKKIYKDEIVEEYYSNHDSYVVKDSDIRYIKEEELLNLTSLEVAIARNEIYAKHGYVFKDEFFKEYFEGRTWYGANINFKGADSDLNNYELKNVQILLKVEKDKEGDANSITQDDAREVMNNYIKDKVTKGYDYFIQDTGYEVINGKKAYGFNPRVIVMDTEEIGHSTTLGFYLITSDKEIYELNMPKGDKYIKINLN